MPSALRIRLHNPTTALEGDGLIVELIQHDSARPLTTAGPAAKEPLYIHGIFKVGVIVSDLEKTLANAIVRDNAGNLIQFFGNESKE